MSKLDNTTRKVHATKFGLPQSCWLRCPESDLVVSSTVLPGTRHVDHAVSHLQQFWLVDAVDLLVYILESAEEIKLLSKAIGAIQALLQLTGNANFHNFIACRNAVLTQLNLQLKQILGDNDYKDAPPCCLGKTLVPWPRSELKQQHWLRPFRFFARAIPKKLWSCRGGTHYSSRYSKQKGWQPLGNKRLATTGKQKLLQAPAVKEMTMYKQSCTWSYTLYCKLLFNCSYQYSGKGSSILCTDFNKHHEPVYKLPKLAGCVAHFLKKLLDGWGLLWLKLDLIATIFKAHSVRGAACSKAAGSGVTAKQMLDLFSLLTGLIA